MSPARERLDGEEVPTPTQLELWVNGPREVVPPAPGPNPERIADEAINEALWLGARLLGAALMAAAAAALLARCL